MEEVVLNLFEGLGHSVLNGPTIAPEPPTAERASFADVILFFMFTISGLSKKRGGGLGTWTGSPIRGGVESSHANCLPSQGGCGAMRFEEIKVLDEKQDRLVPAATITKGDLATMARASR